MYKLQQKGNLSAEYLFSYGKVIDYAICFNPTETLHYLNINNRMFWGLVGIDRQSQTTKNLKFQLPSVITET